MISTLFSLDISTEVPMAVSTAVPAAEVPTKISAEMLS